MTSPNQGPDQTPEKPRRSARKQSPEPPVDSEKVTKELVPSSRKTIEEIQETQSERESRLRIQEQDASAKREEKRAEMAHRHQVELAILIVSLLTCAVVCGGCLWILIVDRSIPSQDKNWAASLLTLIAGGLVGFWSGRASHRSPEKQG